jgi:polyhydroxyalkanoate synthesis regulator phasin
MGEGRNRILRMIHPENITEEEANLIRVGSLEDKVETLEKKVEELEEKIKKG